MRANILVACALLLTPSLAFADDAEVKAACDRVEAMELPKPGSAGPSPKDCDALALYDGVSAAPDYAAARACALNAVGEPDIAFPPEAILAMIFANGDGIARNDDLAVAYACKAGGAPAETSGRVKHLLERKRQGAAVPDRFDYCDDITSGMMMGFCSSRAASKDAVGRDAELAKLTSPLKPAARTAYAKLRKAFEAYRETLVSNEVDLSGTARGAMAVGAREEEDEAFLASLREVLGAALLAAAPLAQADAALNAAYKKVQAEPDESRWGTVTRAGIKTTQRAWLGYRDAFTAFATAAGSKTTPDRLAAALTIRRTENLNSFTEN